MAERTCKTGKIRHKHQWAARLALKRMNNAGLGAYRCDICGDWHLGHEKTRAHDRIAQLLARAARDG